MMVCSDEVCCHYMDALMDCCTSRHVSIKRKENKQITKINAFYWSTGLKEQTKFHVDNKMLEIKEL